MNRSTIVALTIMILMVLSGLGFLGWMQYQESQFRTLFQEVQGLIPRDGLVKQSEPPVARGLLAVWDQTANKRMPFSETELPSKLLAGSAAKCETLICITRIEKENPQKYQGGETGYRQSATVFLVLLPEKKVLGPYVVKGKDPGFIIFRESDNEPILGDLKGPLGAWIQGLPRENSPPYKEMLAQHKIIEQLQAQLQAQVSAKDDKLPMIKGKVLVWDLRTGEPSPVQAKLPVELQGRSTDDPLTVVAVRSQRELEETRYFIDLVGYRGYLTLALVEWPSKRGLGSYEIAGEAPPGIVFRHETTENKKVVGDVLDPLKKWIVERWQP
jgi:hypothetical protein